MNKKRSNIIIFVVCILIAGIIFIFSNKVGTSKTGLFVQIVFSPLEKLTIHSLYAPSSTSVEDELRTKNIQLEDQLAQMQLLQKDNKALRDQFQTSDPHPIDLLPATIVAMPSFLPGITFPDTLIIDKGKTDGVAIGNIIVYKNNLLGVITAVNDHFAKVALIGNKNTSFTAKTAHTGALGIIKGEGNGQMQLVNVILSEDLENGDIIVTSGESSLFGVGYPVGLVVGKITSIEKNPSALFQSANVQSLIDITKLPIVFVYLVKK